MTQNNSRTAQLLALMKKGDDAFNSRDFEGMKAVHHPDMIAHITGNAEPVYGQPAHAKLIKEMFRMFPDVHVYNDPFLSSLEATIGSPWSAASPVPSSGR